MAGVTADSRKCVARQRFQQVRDDGPIVERVFVVADGRILALPVSIGSRVMKAVHRRPQYFEAVCAHERRESICKRRLPGCTPAIDAHLQWSACPLATPDLVGEPLQRGHVTSSSRS
jgi:hypothetical protein